MTEPRQETDVDDRALEATVPIVAKGQVPQSWAKPAAQIAQKPARTHGTSDAGGGRGLLWAALFLGVAAVGGAAWYSAQGKTPAPGPSAPPPAPVVAPDAGKAAPPPDAGKAALTPGAGQAALTPGAGQAALAPDAGQAALAPDAGQAAPAPDAGKAAEEPALPDAKVLPGRKKALRLVQRAERFMVKKRYKAALWTLKKAVSADAQCPAIYRVQGQARAALGQKKQAHAAYRKYLKLAPNAADAPDIRRELYR